MSISGVPTTRFTRPVADSQSLKEAYDLLFIAWDMVKIEHTIPSNNLENRITWRFYDAIVTKKSRLTDDGTQQYCFSFHVGSDVTDRKGNRLGITDIQIQFGTDERNRFIIEAKLLNKKGEYLHNKYISYGMMRFITGQYGGGVQCGGMVGYVLDGNTDTARKDVTDNIEAKRLELGTSSTETLRDSAIRKDVYETSHVRQTKKPFTIYHVFLPIRFV
jgi:hypothetical protein